MKIRFFAPLLLCLFVALPLQAEEFVEDEHYVEVFRPHPPTDPARVSVVEFFWYACPHCYNFEPFLKGWLENKPESVDFEMVPALFERPNVILHARAFYALSQMGVESALHQKIFQAIHDEHRRLNTPAELEAFLEENGVDIEAYHKAMKSFSVHVKINQARDLAKDYEVRGVPNLVVGGKYRTNSLDGKRQIDLLNFLIKKVEQERAAAQ